MKLEDFVVAAAAILYITVGVVHLCKQNFAWSMVWFCYGFANVGIILASKH